MDHRYDPGKNATRCTLLVVPTTLLAQWQVEIIKSLKDPDTLPVYVYVDTDLLDGGGGGRGGGMMYDYAGYTASDRSRTRMKTGMFDFLEKIVLMNKDGGIVLTTYSMLMRQGNECFFGLLSLSLVVSLPLTSTGVVAKDKKEGGREGFQKGMGGGRRLQG